LNSASLAAGDPSTRTVLHSVKRCTRSAWQVGEKWNSGQLNGLRIFLWPQGVKPSLVREHIRSAEALGYYRNAHTGLASDEWCFPLLKW